MILKPSNLQPDPFRDAAIGGLDSGLAGDVSMASGGLVVESMQVKWCFR